MEYVGIVGFGIAGWVVPELLQILGGGKVNVPSSINWGLSIAFSLISASFLIN